MLTSQLPPRIAAKIVVEPTGCWRWTAALDKDGYGHLHRVTDAHKQDRAHRVIYTLLVGALPDGLEAHHTCQLRACVNPAHIQLVTHAEHMRLMRRPVCRRGHPKPLDCDDCRVCHRTRQQAWRAALSDEARAERRRKNTVAVRAYRERSR